jgi:hypothetical protein
MSTETLRMVCFAFVQSIINFGIIFGETNHIAKRSSSSKKERLELSHTQEQETCVENCSKGWKYCP